jgi:hypothetical protein
LVSELINTAETDFYKVEDPTHYARVKTTLNEIEKVDPKEPYTYWARARVAFFEKENFYISDKKTPENELEEKKLALADICHENVNKCIKISPQTAECYLLKGSCYAMQASTWGAGFKSLNVCQPMDQAWEKAMNTPSKFIHQGNITTKQLATILRGILYRAMPEGWWFRFLAGVRGDKKRSYEWMNEAVTGTLLSEPMLVLEKAASTICYGRQIKDAKIIVNGVLELKRGLTLPTRYAMDDFDKRKAKHQHLARKATRSLQLPTRAIRRFIRGCDFEKGEVSYPRIVSWGTSAIRPISFK